MDTLQAKLAAADARWDAALKAGDEAAAEAACAEFLRLMLSDDWRRERDASLKVPD